MTEPQQRLVWDLPLRVFHWLLAGSVVASFVTGQIGSAARQYHMWLGYWMLGLLTFRLLWGIVGTRHSRFASFFPSVPGTWRYTGLFIKGQAPASVGHNPLGSLMVFLMLALLWMQAVSGLFVDDDIFFAGPYAHAVRSSTQKFFEALHHDVIDWIVVLVIAHIAAILYHKLRMEEALVGPMISGKKHISVVPQEEAITSSALLRALIALIASFAFVYWLVVVAPPPMASPM